MKYNKSAQLAFAMAYAKDHWRKACQRFPNLIIPMPKIEMNARLTSTAGRAWLEENKIDLSCYLMHHNPEHFAKDTIPHELNHIIAHALYGSKGHDKAWYFVNQELQTETSRCHNLVTKSQAERIVKNIRIK